MPKVVGLVTLRKLQVDSGIFPQQILPQKKKVTSQKKGRNITNSKESVGLAQLCHDVFILYNFSWLAAFLPSLILKIFKCYSWKYSRTSIKKCRAYLIFESRLLPGEVAFQMTGSVEHVWNQHGFMWAHPPSLGANWSKSLSSAPRKKVVDWWKMEEIRLTSWGW